MMSPLLAYLVLTAADPAAAAAPANPPAPAAMAIDELGMPVDKKKKGKVAITGGAGDCDDADTACRAAACASSAKAVVDTYGGHGAKPMAIGEQGIAAGPKKPAVAAASSSSSSSAPWTGSCPAPAGMAINEKGTATSAKPAKSNK